MSFDSERPVDLSFVVIPSDSRPFYERTAAEIPRDRTLVMVLTQSSCVGVVAAWLVVVLAAHAERIPDHCWIRDHSKRKIALQFCGLG